MSFNKEQLVRITACQDKLLKTLNCKIDDYLDNKGERISTAECRAQYKAILIYLQSLISLVHEGTGYGTEAQMMRQKMCELEMKQINILKKVSDEIDAFDPVTFAEKSRHPSVPVEVEAPSAEDGSTPAHLASGPDETFVVVRHSDSDKDEASVLKRLKPPDPRDFGITLGSSNHWKSDASSEHRGFDAAQSGLNLVAPKMEDYGIFQKGERTGFLANQKIDSKLTSKIAAPPSFGDVGIEENDLVSTTMARFGKGQTNPVRKTMLLVTPPKLEDVGIIGASFPVSRPLSAETKVVAQTFESSIGDTPFASNFNVTPGIFGGNAKCIISPDKRDAFDEKNALNAITELTDDQKVDKQSYGSMNGSFIDDSNQCDNGNFNIPLVNKITICNLDDPLDAHAMNGNEV